ncbi:MAG: LysM peptidoglycan-binding domain-containing protein [Gammaproteobacteria bacterium]|nr:LysM peptidoglycan-binding domain-containing protein [Gammaproteobacteria bacterium]
MRKVLFSVAAAGLLLSNLAWANPEFRSDVPERYTVVKGDTLWAISGRFLNNPWQWPELWHANPQVANPHLIYPGDVLALVYIDGKRRLTKVQTSDGGVIKLSPQVRATPLETPVPAIPLDAIRGFLSSTRVVETAELEGAPYILEGSDKRIASGAGDRVYARGQGTVRDTLGVFRKGKAYMDPQTQEFLGIEAKSIGQAKVEASSGEVLTLTLQRTTEEVLQGDRLLPTDDRTILSTFHPSAPETDIHGTMISVLDGVNQIGQYNVVTIIRGTREGLKEGNVLAVHRKGGLVRDPYTKEQIELPSERAGLLMVFRSYEKISYGLVLQATRPLALGDEVRNP